MKGNGVDTSRAMIGMGGEFPDRSHFSGLPVK